MSVCVNAHYVEVLIKILPYDSQDVYKFTDWVQHGPLLSTCWMLSTRVQSDLTVKKLAKDMGSQWSPVNHH